MVHALREQRGDCSLDPDYNANSGRRYILNHRWTDSGEVGFDPYQRGTDHCDVFSWELHY